MAKINVKGGSDLEIKFTDDNNNELKDCQLVSVANNWYKVSRPGAKPGDPPVFLEAFKEPKPSTVFRACGYKKGNVEQMQIDYKGKPRP